MLCRHHTGISPYITHHHGAPRAAHGSTAAQQHARAACRCARAASHYQQVPSLALPAGQHSLHHPRGTHHGLPAAGWRGGGQANLLRGLCSGQARADAEGRCHLLALGACCCLLWCALLCSPSSTPHRLGCVLCVVHTALAGAHHMHLGWACTWRVRAAFSPTPPHHPPSHAHTHPHTLWRNRCWVSRAPGCCGRWRMRMRCLRSSHSSWSVTRWPHCTPHLPRACTDSSGSQPQRHITRLGAPAAAAAAVVAVGGQQQQQQQQQPRQHEPPLAWGSRGSRRCCCSASGSSGRRCCARWVLALGLVRVRAACNQPLRSFAERCVLLRVCAASHTHTHLCPP
jgi:hypothetical protein